MSALEAQLGTKLILRTTRSLTLTAAGRAFLETCQGPIQVLEEAQRSLTNSDSMVSGVVKLTAPKDLGGYLLSPLLVRLIKEHAGLVFETSYTDEVVDLVRRRVRSGGSHR